MNKVRRAALADLAQQISIAQSEIETIKDELDTLKGEEQEYFDNMPENFQSGDQGDRAQTAIGNLDDADTSSQDLLDALSTAADALDEALNEFDTLTMAVDGAAE